LLDHLKERIRCLEQANRKRQWTAPVSSGLASLDQLLPDRGFAAGTLVEWLGAEFGSGVMTLTLAVSGHLAQPDGMLVIVDAERDLFPPAAADLGVPLERTVVVQPPDLRTQWWALEQSLRSGAVAVTLGWIDRANERVMRRLQLAAETGGGVGFLIRPALCRTAVSWADLRFLVTPLSDARSVGWRLQVELLACRGGGAVGQVGNLPIVVELGNETNPVPVAAELDDPTTRERAAGA
jgi:hypothetical protein